MLLHTCFFYCPLSPSPSSSPPLDPSTGDPHSSSEYKPGFLTDDELKQLVVEVCYYGNNTAQQVVEYMFPPLVLKTLVEDFSGMS